MDAKPNIARRYFYFPCMLVSFYLYPLEEINSVPIPLYDE